MQNQVLRAMKKYFGFLIVLVFVICVVVNAILSIRTNMLSRNSENTLLYASSKYLAPNFRPSKHLYYFLIDHFRGKRITSFVDTPSPLYYFKRLAKEVKWDVEQYDFHLTDVETKALINYTNGFLLDNEGQKFHFVFRPVDNREDHYYLMQSDVGYFLIPRQLLEELRSNK